MARGRFGRRPRAATNLTALVASLYREQRAAEDRVMFDAYANGGKGLDGKPVTDRVMRSYIATRRNAFTKNDPLYAEWSNRLTQLDFKIGEDKVTLAYQQGKVGAGAVASFYRQQLRSIPQDSSFYRTVAGRAAQWSKAAVGAARGHARARLGKAMEGKQNAVQNKWDRYSNLVGVLTDAAKRAGLIAGNQTLTDADATDLQAFFAHGVAGPQGTTITFADWKAATLDAYRGFDTLIAVNKQLGRGYKQLTEQKQKFLDQNLVRVNTIDDRAKYELARENFQEASADAQGDPRAILAAATAYAATLSGIKAAAAAGGTGAQGNDAEFIGGLTNEITALTTGKSNGGSTVFDLQSTTTEATPSSDLNDTAESIAKAQLDVKSLNDGSAYFGQEQFGGTFKVHYFPPGANLDPTGNNGLDASSQQSVVNLGGIPTKVVMKGQPIQALGLVDPQGNPVAQVPINGRPVDIANLTSDQIAQLIASGYSQADDPATVGYVFADPNGKATKFAVVTPDGSLSYTNVNPFGDLATDDKGGLVVYGGSVLDQNGNAVVNVSSPGLINTGVPSSRFLADESITPKDLLALAATARTPAEAEALAAEAETRTKDANAERDYMKRATTMQGDPLAGKLADDTYRQGLKGVTDIVRSLGAPELAGDGRVEGLGSPMALPNLKPIGAPTLNTPTAPTATPTSTPASPGIIPQTQPTAPKPATGTSGSGTWAPKPASGTSGSGTWGTTGGTSGSGTWGTGGTSGGGSWDDSTGGGGLGGKKQL